MKDTFHLNTKLVGLIGHPIKHTYSPFIHNTAATLLKLDLLYLPFDVYPANLKDALRGMVALGIEGFNVTVPHKENIISFLQNVTDESSIIGAVNTIVNDHGKLTGHNTDVHGINESLIPFKDEIVGSNVVLIGAGGSARSVVYTLIRKFKPASISIVNRTEPRAESLKDYFAKTMKYEAIKTFELTPPDLLKVFHNSKLIINATNIGMAPDVEDSAVNSVEFFNKDQIVFDLVYNPTETKLLFLARQAGARTINGLQMLVAQAAKSFELWTGKEMPHDEVYKALKLYLTP